jgi:hypothetical protein
VGDLTGLANLSSLRFTIPYYTRLYVYIYAHMDEVAGFWLALIS